MSLKHIPVPDESSPKIFDYRLPEGIHIRVICITPTPRVAIWLERDGQISTVSYYMDDLILIVQDAIRRRSEG